jgi:phytoene desaturase
MISIVDALYRLALKKGVQFHFDSPVQRIIVHENKTIGVVVNNENVPATAVLSNMDAYFTYRRLLNDERSAKKILKQERSSSAMIFYWGISKSFPQLDLHNIFFAADYKSEFDHLFRLKKSYHDPTVYINITSKCEPGRQAPAGKENWFVMVNTPANTGQDWDAYRLQYRAAIIEKLNRLLKTDIDSLVETETVMDPVSIETTSASFMGSLYGTSSNSRLAAFFRHPNFSKRIAGLYFAGGSVHPGGGIPLCLRSAKIASDLILQKHR